jgi:hypothetical protein
MDKIQKPSNFEYLALYIIWRHRTWKNMQLAVVVRRCKSDNLLIYLCFMQRRPQQLGLYNVGE